MFWLEWRTVSALTRGIFWCLLPGLRSNQGNTKITLEWAQKQFLTRLHTIFYFLHMTNPQMTIKRRSLTHRPGVSTAPWSIWWWCHNRLLMTPQWPVNCDAITWIVISNSLDIDYIHGRLCKKAFYVMIYWFLVHFATFNQQEYLVDRKIRQILPNFASNDQ